MAWATVARWLELAATFAERFNLRMLKDFVIHELQADEIRTFVGTKKQVSAFMAKSSRNAGRIEWLVSIADSFSAPMLNWDRHFSILRIPTISILVSSKDII
jgi:hypothetical protein